jgi:hypothetical protein
VKPLPDSFARVVLNGEALRTREEIAGLHHLPPWLADWYVSEGPFFQALRKVRDGIAHQGKSVQTVFELDAGLAINPEERPWNAFDLWPAPQRKPNNLGSLRRLFAAFIRHAFEASTRLARCLEANHTLPRHVDSQVRVFVRSPFAFRLAQLPRIDSQPWEGLDP